MNNENKRGDKEESINKDSKLNVKENYEINVQNDFIENVINNKVINVSENLDLNVNKTKNIVVNENINYNVQNNLVRTIQGYVHRYVEQDKKERFLQNLYEEVSKSFGINIKSYHLKSNESKQESNEINLEAYEELVLRCGSNALIINQNGIEFKTSKYESNSSNGGVNSNEVGIEGEVINLRLNNTEDEFISKYVKDNKELRVIADTTLKEGREVEVTLFILDNNKKVLVKETLPAIVENSKISKDFNVETLIKSHNIDFKNIDDIYGEIKW